MRCWVAWLLLAVAWGPTDASNVIHVGVSRLPRSRALDALGSAYHARKAAETGRHNETLIASVQGGKTAVETALRSGEGSHTVQVMVGGQTRELIIDTGSGKTAFVCDGCANCGNGHRHAPFAFTLNTRFLSCDVVSKSLYGCLKCSDGKCQYGQTYVEGDYWMAYKVTDTMGFPSSSGVPSADPAKFEAAIEFGCIFEESGVFNAQSADGIMGFSKHPDSIYQQYFDRNVTASRIFAQCLADEGGSLSLGGVDLSRNTSVVRYTPMRDTGYQYWTVSLSSVTIGDAQLHVDSEVFNRDRGCVLDSGTTFVYMPTAAHDPFVAAWRRATGSDDCLPESTQYYPLSDRQLDNFPPICFQFVNGAQLCMPARRYFVELTPGVYAGTIFFSDAVRSTIVGASVLADHLVVYDVDNSRIGMAPAECELPQQSQGQLARVELSLNPGGETFRKNWDYNQAGEYVLVAVTVVAIAGLVNTIWTTTAKASSAASAPTPSDGQEARVWEDEIPFVLME